MRKERTAVDELFSFRWFFFVLVFGMIYIFLILDFDLKGLVKWGYGLDVFFFICSLGVFLFLFVNEGNM